MSFSPSAGLVYGILTTHDRLFQEVRKRGCEHTKVADAKFCPTCGKPTYEVSETPIDGFDDDYIEIEGHTFDVGEYGGYGSGEYIVGIYIASTGDLNYSTIPTLIDQNELERVEKIFDEISVAIDKLFGEFPGLYLVSLSG